MLQRIRPNGRRDDLPIADRSAFFGGSQSGTATTFRTDWAARFREASVSSLQYRLAQILQATARYDRIRAEVGSITVTRAGRRVAIPIDQLITSQLGAALILDSHINLPRLVQTDLQNAARAAGDQPTDDALDREITRRYAALRRTFDTPGRNTNIDRQRLSADRGSFAGW